MVTYCIDGLGERILLLLYSCYEGKQDGLYCKGEENGNMDGLEERILLWLYCTVVAIWRETGWFLLLGKRFDCESGSVRIRILSGSDHWSLL